MFKNIIYLKHMYYTILIRCLHESYDKVIFTTKKSFQSTFSSTNVHFRIDCLFVLFNLKIRQLLPDPTRPHIQIRLVAFTVRCWSPCPRTIERTHANGNGKRAPLATVCFPTCRRTFKSQLHQQKHKRPVNPCALQLRNVGLASPACVVSERSEK